MEYLKRFGAILDFGAERITLDQITTPMQPLKSFMRSTKKIFNSKRSGDKFPRINELEPISTREATKRTFEILDASYEKADLAAVVQNKCSHLTARQQTQLLTLLNKFKVLFDGTLGDFKTASVIFYLKKRKTKYQ